MLEQTDGSDVKTTPSFTPFPICAVTTVHASYMELKITEVTEGVQNRLLSSHNALNSRI